ncbi:MAG TPA: GAF domain-containing protein [Stellaceae bacterium]|nr:GAF domain-containing protein [Stellaceae bacterium]
MSEFRKHPAATFLRSIPIDASAAVALERVVRQRAGLAELCVAALLQPSLDILLAEACRVAAEGSDAPFAKVLEHQPEERQFLVRAGVGWKPGVVGNARAAEDPDNPAGESLAARRPVTVRDVRRRQDYHLPPIYPEHHIVSTANVPILGTAGFYGVLEVDRSDDRPFDALDTTFLATIAGIIADAVERVRRQAALQAAHDARAVLLREHHHRARNNYQSIMARLQRHALEATDADSRRRFEDVERRVFGLAALYDYLVSSDSTEKRLDFADYLSGLCTRMREFYGADEKGIELACDCNAAAVAYDAETCLALGAAVNELTANAIEHAFGPNGGRIAVQLRNGGAGQSLVVMDNGAGFDKARPASIGLSVVDQLVSGAGGSLSRSTADGGTVWTIALPPAGR